MKSYFHLILKRSQGAIKVSFISIFLVLLVSAPAVADDFLAGQPYFSLSAMVASAGDTRIESACCPIAPRGLFKTKPGYAVVGAFGWLTDTNWRGEIEFGYRDFALDSISGSAADGSFSLTTAFVNVAYDFRGESFVTPYLGVGVGGALHVIDTDSFGGDHDGYAPVFQFFTGLNLEVGDDMDIIVGYRFLRTGEMDFNGAIMLESMNIHHFEMGIKFYVEDLFN